MNSDAPTSRLHQTILYRQLFTLGVGTIVGVAWLMVLGSVVAEAGPIGAMIAFGVGACAMIPIALCYAELSGALPFTGGEVVYAFEILGTRFAYIAGICLAFVYLINCVFFAVSAGSLIGRLIPGIQGPILYSSLGDKVYLLDILVGVGGTLLIAVANYRGAHVAAQLQDVATYSLIAASCVFVAAGIWGGRVDNLTPAIVRGHALWGIGGILGVLAVTPYFFGGFNTIPQALSELKRDGRRTHIAGVMSLCILASLLFYCLVLLAMSMVMPRSQLLSFELPIPEAFAVAFHSRLLANVVLLAGIVGLLATWNALFYASTRVLFVLGRSRLIHDAFGTLDSRTGVPSLAIVVAMLITVAGIFLGQGVLLPVVNVTSTVFAFLYLLVTWATRRHRQQMPALSRPYKVPGNLTVIGFATLFSCYLVGLSLYQQYVGSSRTVPVEWVVLLLFVASGALLWRGCRKMRATLSDGERRTLILQ
jgi:APA family basic amino acid/polyamine antiporter